LPACGDADGQRWRAMAQRQSGQPGPAWVALNLRPGPPLEIFERASFSSNTSAVPVSF